MKRDTKFTHLGRPDAGLGTAVNHSVTRASTLLFDDAADLYRTDVRGYGRHGCSVHDALSNMFTELEGGAGTTLFPSGLLACTIPILSQVKTGDHVLLTDSIYGPTRSFCLQTLKRMGVSVDIYDPRIGAKIEGLVKDNTRLIILESPGSLTFEIQDIPAIVKVAKAKSITTLIDNTWSAGLVLSPLKLGVDISCHAATKYFGGHSDIMYGAAVSASESIAKDIAKLAKSFGNASSPDDAYQILRFINAFKLFGIGYSYGGFESLVIHCDPQLRRSASEKLNGPLVRFACGLEHVDDLKSDIENALSILSA